MSKRSREVDNIDKEAKIKKENVEVSVLSDIVDNNLRAIVHAVILWVGKDNGGRFDSELTDGASTMRMVGFEKGQRDVLEKMQASAVALRNCQTQFSSYSKKMEVIIKSFTTIEKSHLNFDIKDLQTVGSHFICVSEIEGKKELQEYDRITVCVKVTAVGDSETVGVGKMKQVVVIADKSGTATLTVWETDVGKLAVGSSYQLNRFTLRVFQGKRHLSWPPGGASISEIEDIGEVVEGECGVVDGKSEKLDGAVVIGVHELDVYYMCMFCKKGSVEVKGGKGLGECRSCKTMQALRNQKDYRKTVCGID